MLNSTTLKTFLLNVFFDAEHIDEFAGYVIPLQGNWWSPLENKDNTVSTWIGYNIVMRKSYMQSRKLSDGTIIKTSIAKVHLQFIGQQAEEFAASVLLWDERYDVAEAMAPFRGQLFNETRRIVPSVYYQEGQNTVLAQNVDFRFLYTEDIQPECPILTGATITGNVII